MAVGAEASLPVSGAIAGKVLLKSFFKGRAISVSY
jgi:hypothetical protein